MNGSGSSWGAVALVVCAALAGCSGDVPPPAPHPVAPRPMEERTASTVEASSNDRVSVVVEQHTRSPAVRRVRVLVMDALAQPVANATVDLCKQPFSEPSVTATSDASGRCELSSPLQHAFVRAHHPDVGRSVAVPLKDFRERASARLRLGRPVVMTGVAVDSQEWPIVGATIKLSCLDDVQASMRWQTVPPVTIAPATVTTDVTGSYAFEVLAGARCMAQRSSLESRRTGTHLWAAFRAKQGGRVVMWPRTSGCFDSVDALFYGDEPVWLSAVRTQAVEAPDHVWLDVRMRDGTPCPGAALYWQGETGAPEFFFADVRRGHQFRLRGTNIKRSPAALLVRGPDGYSATHTFGAGVVPSRLAVNLQPPGDIEVQVLHRGRRARGIHLQVTSWGKRATARLDADGIGRFCLVHPGPMPVQVMRGFEVLATREVYVHSADTARAAVHVDLSK